ncbi:hypothetical protein, partial [Enterobacter hormaechei]|uniref:hypothetical protein n=1 Tax=Enterobacter hormaechei TaxID=158836 RepID=UPI003CC6A373
KIYSHMVTLWGNYEGISQGFASLSALIAGVQNKKSPSLLLFKTTTVLTFEKLILSGETLTRFRNKLTTTSSAFILILNDIKSPL